MLVRNQPSKRAQRLAVAGSVLAALVAGIQPGFSETPAPDTSARIAAARAASKDLGETLKGQLVAAIKSGGPASAIPVCKTIAPAIGNETSTKHNLSIRRTSLKVRNPANAPDAFELRVLEDFVKKLEAGADPMTLEHSEVVSTNGVSEFRYMKAIPTAAEPCLACHGSDLKPEVKAGISKLYPDDKATGFKAGDLRGAFSVTQKIK
ncbi:MAG: DUF3365 domain-containing protein [Hyphomicrobium sp.]|nr:DUF3365 domain-containing protein [Hyphomicrobium sp.]